MGRPTSTSPGLPPGQRILSGFPRFGPTIRAWPRIPEHVVLRFGGEVESPFELDGADLATLPRVDQVSDFHCVATWSRVGLRWSGFRLRDVYDRFLLPRAFPQAGATHVIFRSFDGYWCALPLEDALRPSVLLVDRLDGQPLSVEHGAPLRVLAPEHYGYKSAKHLAAIDMGHDVRRGLGLIQHARGRVAAEERGRVLPGRFYRYVYGRAVLPLMLRSFRKYQSSPRR